MRITAPSSPRQIDLGLLLLRVVTGVIFIAHGGQKLFVYGFAGVSGAFAQMGIPLAGIAGPLTGVVELLAGIALIIGLLTRLAGFGLAVTMVGAIGFAHLAAGFFAPNGFEFPLALLGASSALALAGAGRYSLDAVIDSRNSRPAATQPARTLSRAA